MCDYQLLPFRSITLEHSRNLADQVNSFIIVLSEERLCHCTANMWLSTLSVLTLCVLSSIRGEVFTSIADLEKILYAENDVAIDLKQYIASEEHRLERLKR